MYKFLTTVLISFFLISNAAAQTPTWQNINVFGGLLPIYSQMVFATDTVGYIYGGSSTTLESTTDTGVNFNNVTIKTSLKGPTYGASMAWPTVLNGYLIADTGNIFNNDNAVFSVYTTNGGTSWITSEIADPNLQIQNIYFPTAEIGYGTGSLADGNGDFVAKTTDGGATWNKIDTSTDYSFSYGILYFKDANNGMFFAQSLTTNIINIAYTTNGGQSFTYVPANTDSIPPFFLQWNNDNSWLIGIDSVYRSVDSGKHWKGVVPYDTLAGPATVATFYDSVGFAFRALEPIVYQTNDYGATWTSTRLPKIGGVDTVIGGVDTVIGGVDTAIAISASMPSSRVAYLLALDATSQQNDVMMKIDLTPPVIKPPPGGVAELAPQDETSFTVYSDNSSLNFEAAPPAPEQRTIEIIDLLGRQCASIPMQSNSTSSHLAMSALQPGSYFARLGTSVVKFNIWE